MYDTLTSQTEIDAAIAKLTAKGAPVMKQIGENHVSFFDNGVAPDSGIWSEQLAQETGVLSGVLNGLVKQGLATIVTHEGEGSWFDLTPLGADVANYLAANLLPVGMVEDLAEAEAITLEETPVAITKMTKTQAYAMVKSAREGLRDADEAIYRGTAQDLEDALAQAVVNAQAMLDHLRLYGVTCGK